MDEEIAALSKLSPGDLSDIMNCVGRNGLVQSSPDFKDAIMVNLSILFFAVGIPLMISTAISISEYNTYIASTAVEEEKKNFSNLNNSQIFFLILSLSAIVAGIAFLFINLSRRSKVELKVIVERAKSITSAVL